MKPVPLIVENLCVVERLLLLVLGVAVAGSDAESIRTALDCVFSDGMRLMHSVWRHRWFCLAAATRFFIFSG